MRQSIYSQIKKIARNYGIDCKICGCKNPDLLWEFCNPWVEEREFFVNNKKQLSLFSENGFAKMKQKPVNKVRVR